jgi:hypothetical protein
LCSGGAKIRRVVSYTLRPMATITSAIIHRRIVIWGRRMAEASWQSWILDHPLHIPAESMSAGQVPSKSPALLAHETDSLDH